MEDLSVNDKIILKWDFNTWGEEMWAGFFYLSQTAANTALNRRAPKKGTEIFVQQSEYQIP
jgi:hypothetical protein